MTNLRRTTVAGATIAVLVLLGTGCSKSPDQKGDAGDAWTPADRDTRDPADAKWRPEFVEKGGWGRHVDVEVGPDGTPMLAYYSTGGEQGSKCTEIGMSASNRVLWPLHFARRTGGGWETETVDEPEIVGSPSGLDLEIAPDGTPVVGAMTGEPHKDAEFCGVNDAGLYRRDSKGAWSVETAAAHSEDVAIGKTGADDGPVVGYWPSLAYDGSGTSALVYKDGHFGGRQSDDFKIASLEIAVNGGGGWTPKSVDTYRGAGDRNRLIFDGAGRMVVAYVMSKESRTQDQLGIWVARSSDGGDSWKRVHLFDHGTTSRPAVAVDPASGTLQVLYYNSKRGFPELATLEDPSKFGKRSEGWKIRDSEIGNPRYDSGYNPSMAFDSDGVLHAVFYRCTVASGGLGDCKSPEDAVVHAWRDGGIWEREVVDPGGKQLCGMAPELAFDGAGRPVVAYRCEYLDDDDKIGRGAKFAIKK